MIYIKHKVKKDLLKRINFQKGELDRRELLSIRKSSVLIGSPAWWNAVDTLNNIGGKGSITRIRNICKITGRPRGILTSSGFSRLEWRRWADRGEIPGIRRASW